MREPVTQAIVFLDQAWQEWQGSTFARVRSRSLAQELAPVAAARRTTSGIQREWGQEMRAEKFFFSRVP
jgi:hypothetical protein